MQDTIQIDPQGQPQDQPQQPPPGETRRAPRLRGLRLYGIIAAAGIVGAAVLLYLLWRPDLSDSIVMPYIAHQKPTIDPHLPSSNQLSDKLDEVQFDGLFNLSANPSGVVYADGLGTLVGADEQNVVTVRLRTDRRWHDSYRAWVDDDEVKISAAADHFFSARDLEFTLGRIMSLGSLSPDYILVSQAFDNVGFEGPDPGNLVRFRFKGDRVWKEADIKEVLSFKILPAGSPLNALNYRVGTAGYLSLPPVDGVSNYARNPGHAAVISSIVLSPFIDNSTYTTELRNGRLNVVLETPYGALSPILEGREGYFAKSNVSTTFFAVLFNVERLRRDQRRELRKLIDPRTVVDRIFRVGSPQQREIADYKGNRNNYADYINRSVFPSSSYYIEEKVVEPQRDESPPNLALLPDTVRIKTSTFYGFREELAELVGILNDPAVTRGRVRASVVQNEEIRRGDYDALLVAVSGYRSNFLFDLYNVFLREPDFETYRINLVTRTDTAGATVAEPASFQAAKNFCRLDAGAASPEREEILRFLDDMVAFMSSRHVGDKQEYARRVDRDEQELALGAWLFSLPSLAYFSAQFDSTSIHLYGVASQLSTIGSWREQPR